MALQLSRLNLMQRIKSNLRFSIHFNYYVLQGLPKLKFTFKWSDIHKRLNVAKMRSKLVCWVFFICIILIIKYVIHFWLNFQRDVYQSEISIFFLRKFSKALFIRAKFMVWKIDFIDAVSLTFYRKEKLKVAMFCFFTNYDGILSRDLLRILSTEYHWWRMPQIWLNKFCCCIFFRELGFSWFVG